MKEISFEVAKALKDAGYPQGHSKRVYLISAIAEELAYREFGLFPKDYFPGELVGTGSYYKYDIETCDAPFLEDVAEWLRNKKDIHIVPNFVTKAHKYEPIIYLPNEDKTYSKVMIPTYGTYEEAISIGIDTVIMSLKD